ncbi:MAG TPA: glycosyltransferase family 39 protein [Xanthobacteraceae bacterium]|nr:glycosyltransferase family 39 protein [Xanthobacteraceae bacterium]
MLARLERAIGAWFDPERADRAVAALLVLFVPAWTLFHIVSYAFVDLHPDLVEVYAWSRHPSGGYYKHPPLAALMATAWFAVFPTTDWSFHLLAMVNAAVALFAVDCIARRYVSPDKRLLVLLFLLLTPFYQFHAQRFSTNQVLLSIWPIATYCFLRAFETRTLAWSVAAGATAGLAMLGKYYSVYLVAAFVVAALAHPARWTYLRSPSAWISAAVGFIVLVPHLRWLMTSTFTPFDYVYVAHGNTELPAVLASVGHYLVGAIAYVALPTTIYAIAMRPDAHMLAETFWPSDPGRRMLVVLLAVQLLLPALSAPFLGVELTPLWTMQAWFLLPIIVLAPPTATVPRMQAVCIAATVIGITALALAAAPIVAWSKHTGGTKHGQSYYRAISDEITQEWRRHTDRPLRIVMGDMAEAVSFYSPDHPDAVPYFNLRVAPWVTPDRIEREGYAVLCDQPNCVNEAARRAALEPRAIRREIEVSRRHLGHEGPSGRFTIMIVPPREIPK